MTDNSTGTTVERPPLVTRNIRAELARHGMAARQAQIAIGMTESTWSRRMTQPGTWRLFELEALARRLGVRTSVFTDEVDG